ncbi:MAG: hypothetical protein KAX19_11535 [Candidatus Brocadiae bacterium]|nr:hypothetical protein [Candidatus Brocadiia bacterium]
MSELMIGTSAYPTADAALLREAGIGWIRHGFGFPFVERVGGEVKESYGRNKARAEALAAKGFKIMGVTPGLGIARHQRDAEGHLALKWQDGQPEWCGPLGSDRFLGTYQDTCAWLADDLRGIVAGWQVANELDWWQFRGPINLRQACDIILGGARGLKSADASLIVGPNSAGTERAYFLYGRLYGESDGVLDYCGVDHYYGTWTPGKPEDWEAVIEEVHAIAGMPVLVSEWGFSSTGAGITDQERRAGLSVCELKKWHHSWGPGHTPEGQAAFVEAAFDAFCSQRSALLGAFFYRWEDQQKCWQCGQSDCPAETAWGLVDQEGKPKPAFDAFKAGVQKLVAG